MKESDIEFRKLVNTDDVDMAMENVKGVIVLLQGLELSDAAGSHPYQNCSYLALITALSSSIDEFEEIKKKVAYMDSIIRKELENDNTKNN